MSRAVLFFMAALMLTSCGIRRPLVKPSEIPAYEKRQQEKRERYEDKPVVTPPPAQPEV